MTITNDTFDVLFLLARPGAGKSEVIDFLKKLTYTERMNNFHIGEIGELDDFPLLWTWFEEDDILTSMGYPRLHSTPDCYFTHIHFWDLLIRRLCQDYFKVLRDKKNYQGSHSMLVEFSRGKQHGGFQRAFENLAPELLERGAILYIDVSWEESLRKNRKRFNPDKPDSILEHGLEDEKLSFLYKESDWKELAPEKKGAIEIQGIQVPYAVMDNEDDVTSRGGSDLADRIKPVLQYLYDFKKEM